MLSSVKVIHSHNRPTSYYIRRVYVDVVFLKDVFPDFGVPQATSVAGSLAMVEALHRRTRTIEWSRAGKQPAHLLATLAERVRAMPVPRVVSDLAPVDFGFKPLGEWLSR